VRRSGKPKKGDPAGHTRSPRKCLRNKSDKREAKS
jgi:hypothetical protein